MTSDIEQAMRVALVALQDIAARGAPGSHAHAVEVLDTATGALAEIYDVGGPAVAAIAQVIRSERSA